MKKFIVFILLIVGITSCHSPNAHTEKSILSIDINQQDELSSMLDSHYTYTILETCDESLINEITKIELTKDRIYILDARSRAIVIFDKNGKFINRIHKIGQGPGEYASLTDIAIANSHIYILARDRIIVYSEDGKWIKTTPLDTYYNYFHLINDKLAYLYSGKSNPSMYDFALFDLTSNSFINRISPYDKIDSYLPHHSPFYETDSKELMIINEYDYNIYALTDNDLTAVYTLDFNTKNKLPEDYEKTERMELHSQLSFSSVVTRVGCFNKSDDFIALTFPLFHQEYAIRNHLAVINCKNGEIKHIRLGDKRDPEFPYFSNPQLIQNGYITSAVNANSLLHIEEIISQSHFKEKISEEDNPVLFFYRLKDW
ncbi:6-bladed beta-propeller [Parabacteroides sp. OttesenSCG-928-J18]|nr:6-bladed beta-propeller [Parabacteroides sp. OttesenSCG-928-J18]